MSTRLPGVVAAGIAAMTLLAGPATGTPFAVPSPLGANGAVIRVQDARELPPRQHAALVEAIQQELRQQGFDPGPADGVFGGKTRSAIRSYQRDAKLRVDGRPSKELLDHLKFAAQQSSAKPARRASSSASAPEDGRSLVLDVQRELSVRGYYKSALDGVTGPGTQAAIRAFQRDAGFPVTGTIDERLLAELRVVDADIRADRSR